MTPHRQWLRNYTPLRVPIKLADHTVVYSAGVGNVVFHPVVNGKESRPMELTRVLHVPQLRNNLLACLYLTRHKGIRMEVDADTMHFKLNGTTLFQARVTPQNSGILNAVTEPFEHANATSTLPMDISLWHQRFCHHSIPNVQKLYKDDLVIGLIINSDSKPDPICEPCLAGKMVSGTFPSSTRISTVPLELIHSDLHGPLPVQSSDGFRYWITFIDDCTKLKGLMFLRKKSDAFEAFKTFKAYAENQLNAKIKAFQDDKAGEYMSAAFIKFTDECGIVRRHSTRNRPQQNGVAERANRTIADHATAMLVQSNLPPSFWKLAVAAYVYVWNRLPTAPLPNTTPYTEWFKKKPDVSNLRVFGCAAYVYIQKDKRKSLQPHMEKCIFVGYPTGYKGWLFYNPSTKKLIISERAVFDERSFPGLKHTGSVNLMPAGAQSPAPQTVDLPDFGGDDDDAPYAPNQPTPPSDAPEPPIAPPAVPDTPDDLQTLPDPPPTAPAPPAAPQPPAEPPEVPTPFHTPKAEPAEPSSPPHTPEPPPPSPLPPVPPPPPKKPKRTKPSQPSQPAQQPLRRTTRESRPPGDWWVVKQSAPNPNDQDFDHVQFAGAASTSDPHNYKQAMQSADRDKWAEAAKSEYFTLAGNDTWELVDLPPGAKAIGCGWVFKVKRTATGEVERYKARIVAKGYSQRPGVDYTEVFAPTFRPATLRMILALAAVGDLELRSVDISAAFTNGDLDEYIYMQQPEGFHEGGPNKVFRLRKSLYGLKQSARQWNIKLHGVLSKMGYKRIEADRSVYIYSNGSVRIFVPIYIDDITFASKSTSAVDAAVKELSSHFKCRDLGATEFLLGVGITRDRPKRTIMLHQRQFILDMLDRYGMSDCHPVQTPMSPGTVLTKDMAPSSDADIEFMRSVPYLSSIGTLQYLSTMTCPDIAYTVSYLARFSSNPGPKHWSAVKHLFRYLKGTLEHKLTYSGELGADVFTAYCDAAHGDCKDTGRSTGGYVTMMAGGAIGWSSKLQGIVALSTTEAEYIAAVEAGKEISWMRNILYEFGLTIDQPTPLHIDNQSAISVSKNPEHHGRMKHLDLRFYWLRDAVHDKMIHPLFIPTKEQVADIFTKPLSALQVKFCRTNMGVSV